MQTINRISVFHILIIVFTSISYPAFSQTGQPPVNESKTDSTQFKKSNTADWKDETYRLQYHKLHSDKIYLPDTSIHSFHRRFVNQPYRDLGNNGTATRNLLFTPDDRLGPSLGYHVFDVYRYNVDSLDYYNSNRPYSSFTYQLGGKLEQLAAIMHTQNIKPNFNFAIGYRKINSPGYYNIQRTNHDNGFLTTNYQSTNLHYQLHAGVVYNKEQQDENGGFVNDTFLSNPLYRDRRVIRVAFQNDAFGNVGNIRRSAVSNSLRDYSVMVEHGYTWGKRDTIYNTDSTKYRFQLTPRFSISHRIEVSGARRLFKDLKPDSARYAAFFTNKFGNTDSVYSRQDWTFVDNRFLLNGFIGKHENQLRFSAGLGIRFDQFSTYFLADKVVSKFTSNYIIASLKKEALTPGKWFYEANLLTYTTGNVSGSTALNALIGKDLGINWGNIAIGAKQNINAAPYNYTAYYNQYDTILAGFNKESITQLEAQWYSNKMKLSLGFRNHIVSNYIYLNALQLPDQYATTFSISQLWLRKAFQWKFLVLDNEVIYQEPTAGAPINIPQFLGRHQLAIESNLFRRALQITTGVELRYHTSYTPAAYSPFFNRFYYQNSYFVINQPEESVFFNFRVKRFRCYIMLDQIQQLFTRNTIIAPGYATQNFMFRFGFNWVMIN